MKCETTFVTKPYASKRERFWKRPAGAEEPKEEYGIEEGERCNRDGYNGVIMLEEVMNCSCHMGHGPCGACMAARFFCPVCLWGDSDNIPVNEVAGVCGTCGGEGRVLDPLFDRNPVPCPVCAFATVQPVTSDSILAAARLAGESVRVRRIQDPDERYVVRGGYCWLSDGVVVLTAEDLGGMVRREG